MVTMSWLRFLTGSRRFLCDPHRAGRVVHELPPVAEQPILLLADPGDHVVVQRVHVVLPCLLVEDLDQLGELVGVFVSEVGALGEVLRYVIQLPLVLVEGQHLVEVPRHAVGVHRHRLPAVGPDRPVAEHLVVLTFLAAGRVGVVERVEEGCAVEGRLLDSVEHRGPLDVGGLQHRRHDVGDVGVLRADLTLAVDGVGPVDNEGVVLAAAVLALLEVSERSVAGHRPAGVIVGVGVGLAPTVEVCQARLEWRLQSVEDVGLVEGSVEPALAAGSVVGGHEDQRVVELADSFEGIDDPTDLVIDVLELRREDFHLSGIQLLFVFG